MLRSGRSEGEFVPKKDISWKRYETIVDVIIRDQFPEGLGMESQQE